MLSPINCYFWYPGVALHYLAVWDGSSFLWLSATGKRLLIFCANLETWGAHVRNALRSLVCSYGWNSGRYSWLWFSTRPSVQNHRIIEWPALKRTSEIIWFQPPLLWAGLPTTRPGCQSHMQPHLESLYVLPHEGPCIFQWGTVEETWDTIQDQCNSVLILLHQSLVWCVAQWFLLLCVL